MPEVLTMIIIAAGIAVVALILSGFRMEQEYQRGVIAAHPAALELRRMQMVAEVGVEHNTTTIILLPSDFVTLAKELGDKLAGSGKSD